MRFLLLENQFNKMKKLVLVTGANRGLGLEITRRLVAEEYHVIACCRSSSSELNQLSESSPASVEISEDFDLAKTSELRERVSDLSKKLGPIYGLVNNAAVAHDGVLATQHESEILDSVMTNVAGTLVVTKYVSRSMLLFGEGRIVNIASIIASTGFSGLSVYGATKSSMLGFTKSLARELGKAKITVNSVSPGYMETRMSAGLSDSQMEQIRRRSPLGILSEPADSASAVAWLLSGDAKAVTGIDLKVDAGSTA